MNSILSFIVSFCIISVVLGALYILCPKGTMQKSVRYIFVLLLITSCLALIKGIGGIDFSLKKHTYAPQNDDAFHYFAELTFKEALKNAKVEFSKITVCTDKSENGSILISEVIVFSEEPQDKILKAIGSEEYEVTVINE